MCSKYTKNTTKHRPDMSPRGEGPQLGKTGPRRVENKAKIKPNQLNSTRNHHGPSPEDHRRRPDEVGPIWTWPWCGHTPICSIQPNLWSVDSYCLSNDGCMGIVVELMWRMAVCSIYRRNQSVFHGIIPPLHL
jgi:hypothetical protein